MNHALPDDLILVPYSDASWASAPNQRSQAGLLVLATSRRCLEEKTVASVLGWMSYRLRRVCRSTLAAEACSLDAAVDHCAFFAFTLCEIFGPEFKGIRDDRPWIPVAPTTDCRSLYDAVRKLSTQFQERRAQIDMTAIRETCARTIRWVPTTVQRADGLTKRDPKLRYELRMFVDLPLSSSSRLSQLTTRPRSSPSTASHLNYVNVLNFVIFPKFVNGIFSGFHQRHLR